MAKVIMVFTSMTGNTEEMAEAIAEGVREQGVELDVKEVLDATATELEKYDGILLGAYTWGDGELPDDFLDFYDELDDVDLTGKKAAVFGSCDSSYEKYGAAVDILTEKLQERGAEVVLQGLKIELTPTNEEKQLCMAFGKEFSKQL
ncbi:flavodoxin [Anoxybacillus flavithermus]|uniref:Flavodoxin n=1 Tax=Anoxybacillus flavithermus TaxID=33934 RepID=A0A2G5RMP9_9BACL|nr:MULTISPECIES: flavodoxin [Anoxybacillus]KFZ42161.1 flavodoxin [Anoxybacillus sp. KU2-6(11)]PIC04007.1 flavodoxin [Anoxybacillus flavithermus]